MHRRTKLRRPSRAAVPWIIAIAAMVLAMGGTGLAAKEYLITSTSQISPSVLKKLRGAPGKAGKTGKAGPAGLAGAAGAPGAAGAAGPAGSAKGYAEVLVNLGTVSTVGNVGFPANAARSPQVGIYCIVAPAGVSADGILITSLANGNAAFVTQAGRTVCNPNEYQVLTADRNGTLNNTISFNILAP